MEMKRLDHRECKWQIDKSIVQNFHLIQASDKMIDQSSAMKELSFALQIEKNNYHIFICGLFGSGRKNAAISLAKQTAKQKSPAFDFAYVNHFSHPNSPILLSFPAGLGNVFKQNMNELVSKLSQTLKAAFQTDEYEQNKNKIIEYYKAKKDKLVDEISKEAKDFNFTVKMSATGIYFMPLHNGDILEEDEYENLEEGLKKEIEEKSEIIKQKVAEISRNIKIFEQETKNCIEKLDHETANLCTQSLFSKILDTYKGQEKITTYIKSVQEDVLSHLEDFKETNTDDDDDENLQSLIPWLGKHNKENRIKKYEVNLIINNEQKEHAPVFFEHNPTYARLCGDIDYDSEYGNLVTDYMKINPGVLHQANGGFLILNAYDVLSNPLSWESLKLVLKTKEIKVDNLKEHVSTLAITNLKPEGIPADVKIILTGSPELYDLLYHNDPEFKELFKIKIDFPYQFDINTENLSLVQQYMKKIQQDEKLLPFSKTAIFKLLEHNIRLSGEAGKMNGRMELISDIMIEADLRAQQEKKKNVSAEILEQAIKKRESRNSAYKNQIEELLQQQIIMIDTEGKKIGQINALAIMDCYSQTFGIPMRITASSYVGKNGIINIEKEANMSGSIHDKGVQVLIGYLGHTYAKDFPLSLSCRICFEQSYHGIEGDSASSTELYAIISSLSDLPITQEIAVTGSVNQFGMIQAIGGVNHKIECFFDLCKSRGLSGSQGVIIPIQNKAELMLKEEVIKAVKRKKFHIYAIEHVDQGIELLMKQKANDVHEKVYQKLEKYNGIYRIKKIS